jgi:hypothetical protein
MNYYARYFSFNILENKTQWERACYSEYASNHQKRAPFYISYVQHNTCMTKCNLWFCPYHSMSETMPTSPRWVAIKTQPQISSWPISRRSGRWPLLAPEGRTDSQAKLPAHGSSRQCSNLKEYVTTIVYCYMVKFPRYYWLSRSHK